MKRAERTPIEKAVDEVLSVAMAYANAIRKEIGAKEFGLRVKFLRATRRLERRSGKR